MGNDTIAAIATAMSNVGIGIVRISGPDAVEVADRVFRLAGCRKLCDVESHTIHYGKIYDGNEAIDEALAIVMLSPRSYTREDTVEFDCHGGMYVLKRVLGVVTRNGARLAEPGEFTKRAFFNGRIDLSQAESVMDVIASENDYALKNSLRQLDGSLSKEVANIRSILIHETAFIESALDDPEHFSLDGYAPKLDKVINSLCGQVEKLIETADNGRILRDGVSTVIVGKPNAGKSTLLNALLGEERAIVTEVPGTTRDALEEHVNLDGLVLNVVDTAGIHDTEDIVEKIGVEKAKNYVERADLIVYVVDSSLPLDEDDFEIMKMIEGKKAIILLNKNDLVKLVTAEDIYNYLSIECIVIPVSAKEKDGIDDFEDAMRKMFFSGHLKYNDELVITNERHLSALREALESLRLVIGGIEDETSEDLLAIDMMDAYAALGKIIGEEVGEELINEIFEKFCVGK